MHILTLNDKPIIFGKNLSKLKIENTCIREISNKKFNKYIKLNYDVNYLLKNSKIIKEY
jgi:hypothetical protein